jgi:hypothetical protein
MTRVSHVLLFGFLACALAAAACGGSEPEAAEGAAVNAGPVAPSPEAVAAANRLTQRLGDDIQLVPTQRGLAEIGYTEPQASRDGDFIVTQIRVKNLAQNAIAGFRIDEFWFDREGNTVTGDSVRFREPLRVGQVVDIELRVPRTRNMNSSNYEFTHQNGEIKATELEEIEDPEPAEGEEGDEEDEDAQ